jgi:hypothetical protein
VLVVLALAALAIGGALLVRGSSMPQRAVRSAAVVAPSPLHRMLQREAQRALVPRFQSVLPAPKLAVPEGGTCFVGPGRCSETPCVVPVQSDMRVGSAVVSILPGPLDARCPGGRPAPKTLRVVGP